jgi:hypothetical protein
VAPATGGDGCDVISVPPGVHSVTTRRSGFSVGTDSVRVRAVDEPEVRLRHVSPTAKRRCRNECPTATSESILIELHDRARTRLERPRFVCQRQTIPASGFVVPSDRSTDSTGLESTGERSVTDPTGSDRSTLSYRLKR